MILTAANNSIADVHDRMLLTLETVEIENWLFDDMVYNLPKTRLLPSCYIGAGAIN